jgi:hypothetical protein
MVGGVSDVCDLESQEVTKTRALKSKAGEVVRELEET